MGTKSYDRPNDTIECIVSGSSPGPCYTDWSSTTTRATSFTRGYYSGAETPNFLKRVKAGGILPMNSYLRWDYRATRPPFTVTVQDDLDCSGETYNMTVQNGTGISRLVMLVDNEVVPPSVSVDANWEALAIAAIANVTSDLDALTTAVEAGETLEMIKSVRRTAKDLIREALRGGKHTVKAAADAWLAWRYGWRNLGMDIRDIYEFLRNPHRDFVVRGRSFDTSASPSSEIVTSSWGDVDFEHTHSIMDDLSYSATAYARFDTKTLNSLQDPFVTAWELVPYSFVADWFVNVGDVLRAWQVKRTCRDLNVAFGTKREVSVTTSTRITGGTHRSQSGSGSATENYSLKSRYPGYVPSLVPSINVDLTSKRILDAASLCAKRIL